MYACRGKELNVGVSGQRACGKSKAQYNSEHDAFTGLPGVPFYWKVGCEGGHDRDELRHRHCPDIQRPMIYTQGFDFIVKTMGFTDVFKQGHTRIRSILERLFWLQCRGIKFRLESDEFRSRKLYEFCNNPNGNV